MKIFWIILVVVLVLIYILSPIDGIPDIIPMLGWLDDTFMVGLLAYYLRYKRLPNFLYRLGRLLFQGKGSEAGDRAKESAGRENSGAGQAEKGRAPARDPFEILGVARDASFEEIQTAYRAAAQQYHPDKVAHLGEEFQELAQKKFVEIQEAYRYLTEKHS